MKHLRIGFRVRAPNLFSAELHFETFQECLCVVESLDMLSCFNPSVSVSCSCNDNVLFVYFIRAVLQCVFCMGSPIEMQVSELLILDQ